MTGELKGLRGPSWRGQIKYLRIEEGEVSRLERLIENQTTLLQRIENGDRLGAGAIAAHTQYDLAFALRSVTGKNYRCSEEAWEARERSYWHGVLAERGEL